MESSSISARQLWNIMKAPGTTTPLRNLMPGKQFKDMTIDDALLTLDLDLVKRVVAAKGLSRVPRYEYHVRQVASHGDDYFDLLEYLLHFKEYFLGTEYIGGYIKCKLESPRTLELLWEKCAYWTWNDYVLRGITLQNLRRTNDEHYAWMALKYVGRNTYDLISWCGAFGTCELAHEILKSGDYTYSNVSLMYSSAVQNNNLAMMRYLTDNGYKTRKNCIHPWEIHELLSQPWTPQRKQVLQQMLEHINPTDQQDTNKLYSVLWLFNDPDLTNPHYTMRSHDADELVDILLLHGFDHVNPQRLERLLNNEMSARKERWLKDCCTGDKAKKMVSMLRSVPTEVFGMYT